MNDFVGITVSANCVYRNRKYIGQVTFEADGFIYKAESVNGKICFEKKMYFDILSISESKSLGLIPNRIRISFRNGEEMQLTLLRKKDLMLFLKKKVNECNDVQRNMQ